jgi:uncharacterized protein
MGAARESKWPAFPFCSPKCRLIDLGRWLDGNYGVPAGPDDDELPEIDDEDAPS